MTKGICYAPISIMPAGGGGAAWGGDLIVFVGPEVHLTDLVLPGWWGGGGGGEF